VTQQMAHMVQQMARNRLHYAKDSKKAAFFIQSFPEFVHCIWYSRYSN